MKLAAFDLCGTLYRCNTLFTFTRWLRPRSFWVRLADTELIKSLNAIRPSKQWRRALHLRALQDLTEGELDYYAYHFVREILPQYARPSTFALLEDARAGGWTPLLLSSAPDFLVRPIAHHNNFADWCASRYEASRLIYDATGKKQDFLQDYAPWDALFVCTDNRTDLALLRLADRRIVYALPHRLNWWREHGFSEEELVVED